MILDWQSAIFDLLKASKKRLPILEDTKVSVSFLTKIYPKSKKNSAFFH